MDSNGEFVVVLFNINGKTVKIKVKTKDSRKQLRVGEFKHFVYQKCKANFTDELNNYVWKVYDKKLKKYLWANDNVLINDNDKVQASVKENMTMTVIKPNISRNGSHESVEKYEVEVKERKAKTSTSAEVTVARKASPKVVTPKNKPSSNSTNNVANVTSTPKSVDVKPILMNVVKKYNEEFKWIAEKSGEASLDNDDYDGVWNLIAEDLNEVKLVNKQYDYEEVKEQFGLLLNLYLNILSATNAKVENWQFFNLFHEMDLTPFVKNIHELRKNFETISGIEQS